MLVDLKKAFDLVNHSILLSKLQIYGCSPSCSVVSSYLPDHSQCTNFKGTLSDPLPVSISVLQGSILGPLCFLLFINDVPLFLPQNTSLTMFADDTSITQSSSAIHELNACLNLDASCVFVWANLNNMAPNMSKTKSILVTTQQKFHCPNDHFLNFMINGKEIEQVQHAKLLGVTLDSHLTWEKHIDNICSIVNGRLSLLRRIKPFLNHPCALCFFNSCIYNLFVYCLSAWGIVLVIYCLVFFAFKNVQRDYFLMLTSQSSVNLFSKLKWLPISYLIKLRKLVLLFTILSNPDKPLCLKRKFNFMSSILSTGLHTRACAFNLQVPYLHANSGKCTFTYSAATLLNCLDTDFKQIVCVPPSSVIFSSKLNNFKQKLFILFLRFAITVSHPYELVCYDCRFSLYCNWVRR